MLFRQPFQIEHGIGTWIGVDISFDVFFKKKIRGYLFVKCIEY